MADYDWSSYQNLQKIKEEVARFWQKFPNKFIEGSHNTGVSGNYIDHSKYVRNSFLVREGENLRYCQYVQELPGSKDCYDYSIWGDGNQLIYECCACGINTNRIKFCMYVQENVHDIEYSYCCSSSSYLFGCVGIKRRQYCILNKQYSKEEYEALVPKIRQHMLDMPYVDTQGLVYKYGEFFPSELSPVAYNQSVAQEYFTLTKQEAASQGRTWRDPEEKNYKPTLQPEDLPDRVKLVADSITGEIIACAHKGDCNHNCTTAFRIIPPELLFYRKFNLPLPRSCPNCRHGERISQRSKFNIYERACQCAGAASDNDAYKNINAHAHGTGHCPAKFETAYAPDDPEIVYCEACYQTEVA